MNIPPGLRKFFRFLLALFIIYVAWSGYIHLCGLDHKLDNEALVPCLFYLPPLGILGIGIVLAKVFESVVFIRFVKMIKDWLHKKKEERR